MRWPGENADHEQGCSTEYHRGPRSVASAGRVSPWASIKYARRGVGCHCVGAVWALRTRSALNIAHGPLKCDGGADKALSARDRDGLSHGLTSGEIEGHATPALPVALAVVCHRVNLLERDVLRGWIAILAVAHLWVNLIVITRIPKGVRIC